MIRSDTLNDAPEEIQPDLAGGHKNWLRKVVAESTQAKVGLIVLGAFVLIAIFAPLLAPYDPRQQVGPVYGAPSLQHPLGLDDGGVDMLSLLIYGGRISLIVGFCATVIAMVIGGGIGIFSGYYGGGPRPVLVTEEGHLPGAPGPAARDHRRGGLGTEPRAPDLRDRAAPVDDDGTDHQGAGQERPRARLREARTVARGERLPDHHKARVAADRSAADREHGPDHRGGDLRRDGARVPRSGRSDIDHVGNDHRVLVPADRHLDGPLVGRDPGGPVRRAGDHGVLLVRAGDRGRVEPSAEGVLRLSVELPAPDRAALGV